MKLLGWLSCIKPWQRSTTLLFPQTNRESESFATHTCTPVHLAVLPLTPCITIAHLPATAAQLEHGEQVLPLSTRSAHSRGIATSLVVLQSWSQSKAPLNLHFSFASTRPQFPQLPPSFAAAQRFIAVVVWVALPLDMPTKPRHFFTISLPHFVGKGKLI